MKGFTQDELELVVRGLPYIIRLLNDPAFEPDPELESIFVVPTHRPTETDITGREDSGRPLKTEVKLTGIARTPTYIIYQMENRQP